MDLADGKLAYQQTKPFITIRGTKPLTPKGCFFCFCQPNRRLIPASSIHYLNNSTPNDVRNDAMLIHSPTDFTLFSFIVDCPARTVFGCT